MEDRKASRCGAKKVCSPSVITLEQRLTYNLGMPESKQANGSAKYQKLYSHKPECVSLCLRLAKQKTIL